jgi:hypothetical protein
MKLHHAMAMGDERLLIPINSWISARDHKTQLPVGSPMAKLYSRFKLSDSHELFYAIAYLYPLKLHISIYRHIVWRLSIYGTYVW